MTQQTRNLQPPAVIFPRVVRLVTDPIYPKDHHPDDTGPVVWPAPLNWMVNANHPFIKDATILNMYVEDMGVSVYYLIKKANGVEGRRHLLPYKLVRLIDEEMTPEVFITEMTIAEEAKLDDPDDDDEEEPEEEPPPAANGQPTAVS